MKQARNLGCLLLVAVLLCSCSNSGGDNVSTTTNNTKYLARNILFNTSLVNKAYAQAPTIDTTTQIPAGNVIFENASTSQIKSNNVQTAL